MLIESPVDGVAGFEENILKARINDLDYILAQA